LIPIKPESKMLDEVRRWRKEAYEQRQRQTPAQRAEESERLAAALGLRVMDEKDLVKPTPNPARKSA
jgi:hypothetical protein